MRHFMTHEFIWIDVYEKYREIIPEIMCAKVPDEDFSSSLTVAREMTYSL